MTADDTKAGAVRLLAFRVGRRRFALPLDDVRGIVELPEGESGATAGFHGRDVPVVDARTLGWDGAAAGQTGPPAALVIVAAGGRERALAVDGVEGLVESAEIREWPALVAPFVRAWFQGVALESEGGLLVVDPAAVCGGGPADELGRKGA